MNFQQLRAIREARRHNFNLTEVAQALHTSQPGVSRQIRELEDELGIELFVRAGKRLTGLTEPGRHVMPIVERLLNEASNLRRAADDFASSGSGALRIATTHSQARYALPPVVRDFRAAHPDVVLHLQQGTPQQIARLLLDGDADVGIATESLAQFDELVALPCYRWTHSVITPPDHPLAREAAAGQPLTLARLAQFTALRSLEYRESGALKNGPEVLSSLRLRGNEVANLGLGSETQNPICCRIIPPQCRRLAGGFIYESGHIVVVGWGQSQRDIEAIWTILRQLCKAHAATV